MTVDAVLATLAGIVSVGTNAVRPSSGRGLTAPSVRRWHFVVAAALAVPILVACDVSSLHLVVALAVLVALGGARTA